MRGSQREVDKAPHLSRFFLLYKYMRVEILDLRRKRGGEARRVKGSDGGHAAFARQQIAPHFWSRISHPAEEANTRDNNAPLQD